MNYNEHKNNPKSFRALTGLTHIQFSHLFPYFEAAHDDYLSEYELNGNRRRNLRCFCIYSNSPLPNVPERLFFILVYLKNNPLQEYHAACFGIDQKHCNTFVHCLSHILRLSLETMGLVPAQTYKELSVRLSELSKEGTVESVLLHDGTEREMPRPVLGSAERAIQREKEASYGKECRCHYYVLFDSLCEPNRLRQNT